MASTHEKPSISSPFFLLIMHGRTAQCVSNALRTVQSFVARSSAVALSESLRHFAGHAMGVGDRDVELDGVLDGDREMEGEREGVGVILASTHENPAMTLPLLRTMEHDRTTHPSIGPLRVVQSLTARSKPVTLLLSLRHVFLHNGFIMGEIDAVGV